MKIPKTPIPKGITHFMFGPQLLRNAQDTHSMVKAS